MKTNFLPITKATVVRSAVLLGMLGVLSGQLSGSAFCQTINSPPCLFSTVTRVQQTAGGTTSRVFDPQGVVVDAAGNICFADFRHQVIYRISSAGTAVVLAGQLDCAGSADGKGNQARFRNPHGLAADTAGNIYVADSGNSTIRKISPAGKVTTLAGCAGTMGSSDGKDGAARFKYPTGIAVDGSGNVYVADMLNHTIRKITQAGLVTTLAGISGRDGSTDGRGKFARFDFPGGIAVDRSGNIFIADMFNNTIRKATPDGMVTTLAGHPSCVVGYADGTAATAQFSHPWALAVDDAENVYVADAGNNTIRRIAPSGATTTLAGEVRHPGYADGCSAAARFWHPVAIALDRTGNVYVADLVNGAIRKGVFAPRTNANLTFTQRNAPGSGRND